MRLRDHVSGGRLLAPHGGFAFSDLLSHSVLPGVPALYANRSILLLTRHPASAAQALIALDGLARRIVLAPPDFKRDYLDDVLATAEVDVIVADGPEIVPVHRMSAPVPSPRWADVAQTCETEWVMFTSGTTGVPKMVVHTLDGLTGAIRAAPKPENAVWATFYDIRRYGGLQILLRAILGGTDLGITGEDEPISDYLTRLKDMGVTHLTGTPSHWRQALMSPRIAGLPLAYARLSGEIADQAILDRIQAVFPNARVGHAYASTEAGVGFEVTDGLEGFPAEYLDRDGPVRMKIVDGVLHVRSTRTAARYLGDAAPVLADAEGYVDTDDMIELRGDRCLFKGRRAGLINVGGLKINPEEVEAVLNRHPDVDLSRVYARKSPVTGALVAAEVVLKPNAQPTKSEILDACRSYLGAARTPVSLTFVDSLPITAGGKLERQRA